MNNKIEIDNRVTLYHADCFDIFPEIEDKSIDMVLADLPYGTTVCKWDSVLDLDRLWIEYKRLTKSNAALVFTASQPFTSILVLSNIKNFALEWIWKKNSGSNFANMKSRPMKEHESVLVFCSGRLNYNPIMQERTDSAKKLIGTTQNLKTNASVYGEGNFNKVYKRQVPELRYPSSVQCFNRDRGKHPTQKPVALMEYLIKTYTNENDLVLDNTMGSGTTGVACINTGRRFIGIEKEESYFNIAVERIQKAIQETDRKVWE